MSSRHEKLLKAVNQAAELLFQRPSWREAVPAVLCTLGEATGVSHVYLFQSGHDDNESPVVLQRYEWSAFCISSQISNAGLQEFSLSGNGLERWYRTFANKRTVVSDLLEMPPEIRVLFQDQGIQSLVMLPIHINERFWGFIGFDDCLQDREWMPNEIEALEAATNIIGIAIKRQTVEQALRDSDNLFRQLADNVREVFFIKDFHTDTMIYVSPAYEEIWGDNSEHVYQDSHYFLKFIHPDDKESFTDQYPCYSGSVGFDSEFRILRPDDGVRWIWWRSFPVHNEAGEIYRIVCIADDITERKEAEQKRLAREQRQRATLVREVHHRVKNNLQGIIGLLRQQLGVHPDLRGPMEDAIAQIGSMAIVYGLQGKKDPDNVYLCEIVKAITDQARDTNSRAVEVSLDFQIKHPLKVHSEETVPLALIINELVTNALKHSTENSHICIHFSAKEGRGGGECDQFIRWGSDGS